MSLTPSTMMPLGTPAPDFALPDVRTGDIRTLDELTGRHATVVMFICRHCPYVKHVEHELARLADDYSPRGVGFIGISANDAQAHPRDAPASLRQQAESVGFNFPYLHDATQEVARAYQAACTPDFYVFDAHRQCAYRGQLDDSRPASGVPVTGRDIRAALDCLLSGRPVPVEQTPSIGCNIKWKA